MKTNTEHLLATANERMKNLQAARQLLAEEMTALLDHHEEENLTWKGSKVDLMEAIYCTYESETMTDDYGMPVAFAELVRRCCCILHVSVPRNPYEAACRGRRRKGIKRPSYMQRYQVMSSNGTRKALWKSISHILP